MSPLDRMTPSPAAIAQAAREMAWRDGVDVDMLETIVGKVTRYAQRTMLLRMLPTPDNDEESG